MSDLSIHEWLRPVSPSVVGAGHWTSKTDPHRAYQCSAGTGSQSQAAIPILCWGGQTGQVLGPGV